MKIFLIIFLWIGFVSNAIAQPEQQADSGLEKANIFIELNALDQQDNSCKVSFVLKNNLTVPIREMLLELVLFNQSHQVKSIISIKSGALPVGKTRVKQYGLKAITCSQIGHLLINDIKACQGEGLTPAKCLSLLKLSSRTKAKLGS